MPTKAEGVPSTPNSLVSCPGLEVRDGPYYICVICNRCLYKRSVKIFHSQKYNMPDVSFFYIAHVKSFKDEKYICLTCDKKLIKSKVPC